MQSRSPEVDALLARGSGVLVGCFVLALWLPLIASLLEPATGVSLTEKRRLAAWPAIEPTHESLASFPRRMEAYSDDHMGLRASLVRAYAWLEIELFGVSPSESLIVGKQGWLFFGDPHAVAQHRGLARFDEATLEAWRRALEERRDWLAERGIPYLVVLVPNKHSMYSEFMPDRLPRTGSDQQLTRLVEHLATHSDLEVLDLRAPLEEAKRAGRIYHRTDTHWNGPGAYTAYEAILARLRELDPQLAGLAPVEVVRELHLVPGMGLAQIVGLAEQYPEQRIDLTPVQPRAHVAPEHRASYAERVRRQRPFAFETGDSSLPRALMLRDSFANALVPYLSENFERILYVWSRDFFPRIVLRERPDVVIQQITERFIDTPPSPIHDEGP